MTRLRWIVPTALGALAFGCVQIIGAEPGTLRGTGGGGGGGATSSASGGATTTSSASSSGTLACDLGTCQQANDCSPTEDDCTEPACSVQGCCTVIDSQSETLCNTGVCDGEGHCVQCVSDEDCPSGMCVGNLCA
jgi:hypothetical protein